MFVKFESGANFYCNKEFQFLPLTIFLLDHSLLDGALQGQI